MLDCPMLVICLFIYYPSIYLYWDFANAHTNRVRVLNLIIYFVFFYNDWVYVACKNLHT